MIGWVYGISTRVGYLMPNPIYTHTHTHTYVYIYIYIIYKRIVCQSDYV